ncbi:hypothetical protein GCM10020219_024450 [Nonomuraea dietziae]
MKDATPLAPANQHLPLKAPPVPEAANMSKYGDIHNETATPMGKRCLFGKGAYPTPTERHSLDG